MVWLLHAPPVQGQHVQVHPELSTNLFNIFMVVTFFQSYYNYSMSYCAAIKFAEERGSFQFVVLAEVQKPPFKIIPWKNLEALI